MYTQPFPNVVDGTTIESAVYNGFTNDVALQLNGPIPVSAGGTGGSSAASAAANLGVVTGKAVMTYTEAEKTQARSNIYAAPFDALAYNGMQVNGSMEVSQERGFGIISALANAYICDGWSLVNGGTMVTTASSYTSAGVTPAPGFWNTLMIVIATAQASMGANDYLTLNHVIEGYRMARLCWGRASGMQPITISFWTAHNRPGLYSGSVRNGASDRTFTFTYTQTTADTWQYQTVDIPACPDGTWDITNGVGMRLAFTMAIGATRISPAVGGWYNTSYVAAPGQVNAAAATTDRFRITGVVVLPGIEAPSAARSPLIMRPYDQELVTCQRYFWCDNIPNWIYIEGISAGANNNNLAATYRHPVFMRNSPTITLPTLNVIGAAAAAVMTGGSINNFTVQALSNSAVSTRMLLYYGSGALKVDARL